MGEPVFQIKKQKSSNKTIRMPDELIDELQRLADENNTSFNQVVVQCCQFVLQNRRKTDG